MDFDYLLAQAKLESSLDPSAKARTSSASGLYQFIDSTWLETLGRHGERLGLGNMSSAIDTSSGRARVADPSQRASIMALRFDPQASALMAGALASDNRAALTPVLGREPGPSELYVAHFLGAGGASQFFQTLRESPDTSAAAILPRPAAANRGIFYERSGAPRSVGEVMQLFEAKITRAMEGKPAPAFAAQTLGSGPVPTSLPQEFAVAQAEARGTRTSASDVGNYTPRRAALTPPDAPEPAGRRAMSDILADSFGSSASTFSPAAQARTARAYGQIKAFGL
ncbi:Peptidoglycan hydrolase gp181 [Alteripontixanthobacter maritimus]|uniref:Peptidoglycan hydrolase gp181 n=2 Tax=Alteripontixanthobacter maritimus TaxID=2161824 RepID=A0A369Q2N7_9SPHN|nr:Peptidoglycan hydrolase gp181 [Alteripontixanthobacter maritimus]